MTIDSDNGANVKKAVNDELQKHHHPCVAHTLNLSVNESLTQNEELNALIKKCRALVGHFKHSVVDTEKLKNVQLQMGMPILKVKQDVATRWNSIFIMIEGLVQIKDALCIAVANLPKATEFIDADEWEILNECLNVLKPANDLKSVLSGKKYPTILLVTSLIREFHNNNNNKI